jgi:hypothetical protein
MDEEGLTMLIYPENGNMEPFLIKFYKDTPLSDIYIILEEAIDNIHHFCQQNDSLQENQRPLELDNINWNDTATFRLDLGSHGMDSRKSLGEGKRNTVICFSFAKSNEDSEEIKQIRNRFASDAFQESFKAHDLLSPNDKGVLPSGYRLSVCDV